VVDLLDKLLTIDPKKRLTMDQTREHPWVLERKLQLDQGVYNNRDDFIEDDPVYRGMGPLPTTFDDSMRDTCPDEDEMPVYRSLALGGADSSALPPPGPPPPLPGLMRQKAKGKSNFRVAGSSADMSSLLGLEDVA